MADYPYKAREAGPDDERCAGPECTRAAVMAGLCWAHYMQIHRGGKVGNRAELAPLRPARHDGRRVEPVSRPCGWCGETITRAPSLMTGDHVYCSFEHKGLHQRAMTEAARPVCGVDGCDQPAKYVKSGLCGFHYGRKVHGRALDEPRAWMPAGSHTCEWCGATFKRRHAQMKATAADHLFCSQKCYHAWLTDRADARYVDRNGYAWLRISKMDESRREFARECAPQRQAVIAEHRLIVAEMLGRKLDRSEQVHHINGVRDDNRPENLEVQGNGNHQKLHADVYAEVCALRLENERLRELVTA